MRFAFTTQALVGAVAVSALTVPRPVEKRLTLVDLKQFGSFPTITPEQAHSLAEAIKGPFSDGPEFNFPKIIGGNKSPAAGEDKVVTTSAAAADGTCDRNNPKVRVEWRNYSPDDRKAFVSAIKCLMDKPSVGGFQGSKSRYEDIVSVHQQMTPNIHQRAVFLPWHRYYVSIFEDLMRNECGFNAAFPWWDETKDAGHFADSDLFTDEYFGPLPGKTSNGQGTCIDSGTFGGLTLHIGPGSGNQDHCLSRAVDESLTGTVSAQFVQDCNSRTSYDDMRGCQELGPHAYGHNGVGAVMAEVQASPGDPIFFMHHLFVDHSFRIWQNADASRTTSINGCSDTNNPCTQITMDYVLSSNGLKPNTTIGNVMDTMGGYLCYRYDY
ncbi:Di-copper centre-containing protein [Daldinia vernicosa]|uniref:Di-copper centre-containing protein n=1 Tax=Daldinia vernicosa TaxID=114800 RepID=UPI0020076D42|nr:Di-copper centre-containing protein [Daldinia vernicosa]KAI0849514.1 Di-copper centre-containing protein [Daldinia vernicosa]